MENDGKKILVVEDDEALNQMLNLVLQDIGHQVDPAYNGIEASELLSKNSYDLLVTDIFMPSMNGIELVKHCQRFFLDMPIIILSGGGREVEVKNDARTVTLQGETVTVNHFIKKPCDLDEFLELIEKIFNENLT